MYALVYFAVSVIAATYAWFSPVTRYGADGRGRLEVVGRLITTMTFFFWPLTLPVLIYLHVQRSDSHHSSTAVPVEVLSQLRAFGEAALEARALSRPVSDPRFSWENFIGRAYEALRASPSRAIGEIYAAAYADQLAQFGGYSLIAEFDASSSDPRYLAMLDASLQMMFGKRLSSAHLNRYEADRWIATYGDLRTSFDQTVEVAPLAPDHAAEVVLAPGETLMVATLGPDALDNQFWIERTIAGTYGAFSMRQWERGDATLTRCAEDAIGQWESIEEVLASLGSYLGTRPFWAHGRLDPYFRQRRDI